MKQNLKNSFILIGALMLTLCNFNVHQVLAGENFGALTTCERQAQCAEFQVMKSTALMLCDDAKCEFEVCLRLYQKEGGNCPSSVSHTCKKPIVMCREDTKEMWHKSGFPKVIQSRYTNRINGNAQIHNVTNLFADEIEDNPLEILECQVVGPNQLVEFLVKDGNDPEGGGCAASRPGITLTPESGIGGDATCAPRPASTESCTGNQDGVECIWTYHTPSCDGSPNSIVTAEEIEKPTNTKSTTPAITNSNIEGKALPATSTIQAVPLSILAGGGVSGDPHFKTWARERYDFHGVCDLVLLQNPDFQNGLSMDIHVRTKKIKQWSYVSAAVLRIGNDTLEVSGHKDGDTYWINGVEIRGNKGKGMNSVTISGYPVTYRQVNSQQKEYAVQLGNREEIVFKTWKNFVRVNVNVYSPNSERFKESLGLMGAFPSGERLSREKQTMIDNDINEFGQEWQVRMNEPKLFHVIDGVQAPERCEIPSTAAVRRRLAESSVSLQHAEQACRTVDEEQDYSLCIFDVIATGDLDVASAY